MLYITGGVSGVFEWKKKAWITGDFWVKIKYQFHELVFYTGGRYRIRTYHLHNVNVAL